MRDVFEPVYRLVDPRPIAAEAPYTFFLPTQAELDALAEGDLVKLIFEPLSPGPKWSAERMWVIVTGTGGASLTGKLDNQPHEVDVELGDIVRFERHHAIAVDFGEREVDLPVRRRRGYWSRCFVDGCVLDGSEPVECLYRIEPEARQKGDEYPDSGWRIRGRQGAASDDEMAERDAAYVALGAVLNRDDSWLELIDAPVGSAYMRDFDAGRYDPVADDETD